MRYLDDLPARFGGESRWELAYPLIENSRFVSFLHTRGYRFVFFPTEFWPTRQNRYADLQIPDPAAVRSELVDSWTRMTAVPLLRRFGCRYIGCNPNTPPYLPATPEFMDWRFRALGAVPADSTRPSFVLAHLMVPHEPYIYGPECQHRWPFWPLEANVDLPRVRQMYGDQVQCVNRKILAVIDNILGRAAVPPIILIQSDHGHGHAPRFLPPLATADPATVRSRASVFAAYFLPGVSSEHVPDTITPINVTRLVLRHYFGADLPPVADAMYWSATTRPYALEKVH
jgi:hypothetical protein